MSRNLSNRIFRVVTAKIVFVCALVFAGTLISCNDPDVEPEPIITSQSFHPMTRLSGRAVAVAYDRGALAASETGGAFESDSRGIRWVHIANSKYWSHDVNDIEFSPYNTRNIIAATRRDLSVVPNGGIWRSRNGGLSFERPNNATPTGVSDGRCNPQYNGYVFSFDDSINRIYVGTDCGYSWSDDGGDTWSHGIINSMVPLNSRLDQDRVSNIVGVNRMLYAITAFGVFHSTNQGGSWTRGSGIIFSEIRHKGSVSRLAVFPDNPSIALVALDDSLYGNADTTEEETTNLYLTLNGGSSWEVIESAPDTAREAFIKITPVNYKDPGGNGYTLYWGRGVDIKRAAISQVTADNLKNLEWESVNSDHSDINDIAFHPDTKEPILLATDGGIELTDDAGENWRSVGAASGYRALQIYKVDGQHKYNGSAYEQTDLYFGTQDNGLYSSKDEGIIWDKMHNGPEGCVLNMVREVMDYEENMITGVVNTKVSYRFRSDKYYENRETWDDAGDIDRSVPMVIEGREVVQFGDDTLDGSAFDRNIYYSANKDEDWTVLKTIDKKLYGLQEISRHDVNWITFGVEDGGRNPDGTLLRNLRSISNINNPLDAKIYRSDASFGSLGIRGLQFLWTPVFGVNPNHPNHIIAPDIVSKKVRFSLDGGVSWQDDNVLTDLITDGGTYEFFDRNLTGGGLMITEVSFNPDFPNHILIGTRHAGIFKTSDGGLTWEKIKNTWTIPYITSFFWDTPNNQVIVSSFGRGLYKLYFGEGQLSEVPENIREPFNINPNRAELGGIMFDPTISFIPESPLGNSGVIPSGASIKIIGSNFFPSSQNQPPVTLTINEEVLGYGYPNVEGVFTEELPIDFPEGAYQIKAIQQGANGDLITFTSIVIGNAWDQEEQD